MADYKINSKILNQLKKYFGIGWKEGDALQPADKLFPFQKTIDAKGNVTFDKEQFPDEIKKLFNWWISDCHDNRESWNNRKQLFQDMDMIYYNMAMIAKAMEIMSDEVVQADLNMQPIFIEAKRNVKKFILDFFDKVGIYNLIRSTVLDIVKYGNAGWLLGFDDKGISEIIPVDMYDLKDRLEFTPDEVDKKIKGNDDLFSQFKAHDRINDLINSITNKENISSFFKSYLFGFQINDQIVPPWRFIHFRNFTNSSPFKPFGVPIFINSVAPYRQWDAAMTMQIVARGAKFPKEVYKLKLPNIIDPSSKLDYAVEFLNQLMNSGIGTAKKELPGINEIRITIDDLFDWSMESPEINLDKIDDIQMLLDEVANSTFLPRNLIDPRDSGFGDSGVSLVEKFKPFARLVFRIQNIFLSNLSQVIKIHMIHSGEFSLEEMDFVLSMPYPESQINPDIVSSQTSQWNLANEVISSLSDKLLGGEPLPTDVIRQVYQKILPYDDETIEKFINGTLKARKENDVKDYEKEIEPEQKDQAQSQEDNTKSVDQQLDTERQSVEKDKLAVEREKINIDQIKNAKERSDLNKDEEQFNRWKVKENIKAAKKWKKLEATMGKTYLQEKIDEEVFQIRQNNLREGIHRGKHFFSSKNIYTDFPAEQLREFDKKRLSTLKEMSKNNVSSDERQKYNKTFYKEEVNYIFNPENKEEEEKES